MRADDDLIVEFGGILVDGVARFATCTTHLVSCKADRTASWGGGGRGGECEEFRGIF